MNVSPSVGTYRALQSMSLTQDEHRNGGTRDELAGWLPQSSATSLAVAWLSKIVASDVAQVGDLMINGRDNAVLAPHPPAKQ